MPDRVRVFWYNHCAFAIPIQMRSPSKRLDPLVAPSASGQPAPQVSIQGRQGSNWVASVQPPSKVVRPRTTDGLERISLNQVHIVVSVSEFRHQLCERQAFEVFDEFGRNAGIKRDQPEFEVGVNWSTERIQNRFPVPQRP